MIENGIPSVNIIRKNIYYKGEEENTYMDGAEEQKIIIKKKLDTCFDQRMCVF